MPQNEEDNNGIIDELKALTNHEESDKLLVEMVTELSKIKEKIDQIEGTDTSRIEELLISLVSKKDNKFPDFPEIDLSELKKISSVLEKILATPKEEQKFVDYTKQLKEIIEKIYFDKDEFLKELKEILKDALKVTVYGGGGGGSGWQFITEKLSDNLSNYKISDKDDDASPNYYGFIDKDGNWYILKFTESAGADTFLYCKGTSGYTTNWTSRAGLTYQQFNLVF
jgi:hypothetical protein